MALNDNPYSAPLEHEQAQRRCDYLHIDNWWFGVSNLVFARIGPGLVIISASWSAVTAIHAANERSLYLQLMMSLLWIVMMGIVFWRRGRHPIILWCDLAEHLTLGRIRGREDYPWSAILGFDYEGVGNPTRLPVVSAPIPVNGQRILIISALSGEEFRIKVGDVHFAALKDLAVKH